jgi:hypothetical protein
MHHRVINPSQFSQARRRANTLAATACLPRPALSEYARLRLRTPSSSLITATPGSRPIVAYTHGVFATPCALNVPASASARPSRSGMRVWSHGR